jgi:hypothetical protein
MDNNLADAIEDMQLLCYNIVLYCANQIKVENNRPSPFVLAASEDISFYRNINNNTLLTTKDKIYRPVLEFSIIKDYEYEFYTVNKYITSLTDKIKEYVHDEIVCTYLTILKMNNYPIPKFINDYSVLPYNVGSRDESLNGETYRAIYVVHKKGGLPMDEDSIIHKICRIRHTPLDSLDNYEKGDNLYFRPINYLKELYAKNNSVANLEFKRNAIKNNTEIEKFSIFDGYNIQYSTEYPINSPTYTIPIFMLYLLSVLHIKIIERSDTLYTCAIGDGAKNKDYYRILAAFLGYKGSLYYDINKYILNTYYFSSYRSVQPVNDDTIFDATSPLMLYDIYMLYGFKLLSKCSDDVPDYNITVFRNTRFTIGDNKLLHKLEAGNEIIFPNYVSTTINARESESTFSEKEVPLVRLEIEFNLKTHCGLYFALEFLENTESMASNREGEILLRRNCKFRVISKKYMLLSDKNNISHQKLVIKLQLLGSEPLNNVTFTYPVGFNDVTYEVIFSNTYSDVITVAGNMYTINLDAAVVKPYRSDVMTYINKVYAEYKTGIPNKSDITHLLFNMDTSQHSYTDIESLFIKEPIDILNALIKNCRFYQIGRKDDIITGGGNPVTLFPFIDFAESLYVYKLVCAATNEKSSVPLTHSLYGFNGFLPQVFSNVIEISKKMSYLNARAPAGRATGGTIPLPRINIYHVLFVILLCFLILMLIYFISKPNLKQYTLTNDYT